MTNSTMNHHSVLITSPKHIKPSLTHQTSFTNSSPKHLHSKSTNCLTIPSSPSSFNQQSPSNNNANKPTLGLSPSNGRRRNSGLFSEKIEVPIPSFNISPSHETTPNHAQKLRTFSFHSSTTTSSHLNIQEPSSCTKLPSLASPKSPSATNQSNTKHSVLKRNNSAHIVLMRDHSPVQVPKRQQVFASPSPTPSQTPSSTSNISPTNQYSNQQYITNSIMTNNTTNNVHNQSLLPQHDQSSFSINRKVRSASHTPSTMPPVIITSEYNNVTSTISKESKGVLGPIDRTNMRVTFRKKAAAKKDLFRSATPNQSPKKENGSVSFADKFTIAVETQKQIEALTDYVKLDSYSFGLQNEEYKSTSNYDLKYDEEMYKAYVDQNQDMKTLFDVHNLVREYVSSRGVPSIKKIAIKDSNKLVLDIIRRYNQKTLKKNKSEQTLKSLLK